MHWCCPFVCVYVCVIMLRKLNNVKGNKKLCLCNDQNFFFTFPNSGSYYESFLQKGIKWENIYIDRCKLAFG